MHTLNAAVEAVARFMAGSAVDDTSAFNSRAEGIASPSTNATGSALPLFSAPSRPVQRWTTRTGVSSAPSAAGLLSLGGNGHSMSSFRADSQTPSAFASGSMGASHNFRGDAQRSSAFASTAMNPFAAPASHNSRRDAQTSSSNSTSLLAAPGSHNFRGGAQTSSAFARASMNPFAAPASRNFWGDARTSSAFATSMSPGAEFLAFPSPRLPDPGALIANEREEGRPMADAFALAATRPSAARDRSRSQRRSRNQRRAAGSNPANEPVRSAVADQGHHPMGAGRERRTRRQDQSLVDAGAQANEANERGNEARQQMEDHALALHLQIAERRAAVREILAERNALLQEVRERQRVMLERRRVATQAALAIYTAEVVHKSTPRQSEGDSQQDQCSVCLEKFQDGEQLRLLPCMHKYHTCCIDEWFQNSPACPVCKHSIIPSTSTTSASQVPVVID